MIITIMQRFLLLIAFFSYSSLSYATNVRSNIGSLDGDFSFTEGNQISADIKTEIGSIDNFLRSEDDKQQTNFLAISPDLFIQTQGSGSLFQIQAKASYNTFDEFSDDDHLDFSVLSKFHLRFAESQKIFATGFIGDEYEYRGTGLSLGAPNLLEEGDTKRNEFLNFGYLYGHQDSLARAKILAGYRRFTYLTRESITQRLAYSTNYLQGDFDYLISGNTYFNTKLQYENFSYEMNDDLERKQYLALAGVKWRSTELTQLQLLLGYEVANFNKEAFDEKDHFAWQVNMRWNPLSRVRFNFTSGSEIKDSYKLVKSISFSNYYDLGVSYDFSEKVIFTLHGKLVSEDIESLENKSSEESLEAAAGVNYQWRHWLSGYAKYEFNTFDSSRILYRYDLQSFSVGVVVTL